MTGSDLIVVGGGRVGCSAALAAAQAGCRVLLLDDGAPRVPGVHVLPGRVVWMAAALPGGGFTIDAVGPAGRETWCAPRLIAATGTRPRITPFPGWTLPGIRPMGRTAGRRIVVIGGECRDPRVVATAPHALRAEGSGHVARILLPQGWVRTDAVLLAGTAPEDGLARLLGAATVHDGAWRLVADDRGRTTIPHLYTAGPTARTAARAGLAAATDPAERPWPGMHSPAAGASPPASLLHLPPATLICPCEQVTRADVDTAMALGATTLNQFRAFTRCGMGACQGALCQAGAEALLGARAGAVAAGQMTVRPPLRPVPFTALLGDYTYADIPVPPPAPL